MWSAAIYLQSMRISVYIMGLYLEVRHSLKRAENITFQRRKKKHIMEESLKSNQTVNSASMFCNLLQNKNYAVGNTLSRGAVKGLVGNWVSVRVVWITHDRHP